MNPFHVTVHVRPADATPGAMVEMDGREFQAVRADQSSLCVPFQVTFEEVLEAFERLPRMHGEPDGSFVWRGTGPAGDWQLDGQLTDRGDQLAYVELRGTVDEESFDALLGILGWPETELVFQLVRAAILLDEREFRRLMRP